jgi:hypothetical protein
MHRLFIDQNIRIEVAASLRDDGHEVVPCHTGGFARAG